MRQSLPVLAAFLFPLGFSTSSAAEQREPSLPIVQRVAAGYSRIVGIVRDQSGSAVPGVSVLAVGATLAAAKSDVAGHFAMLLPAGEYILRAARDGYVSTYRESVRVQREVPLRRTITLLKASAAPEAQPGSVAASLPPASVESGPDGGGVSEVTWRLRRLPRTVLRERAAWTTREADERDGPMLGAREPFWSAFDLRGSLDLMTTSSLAVAPGAPVSGDFPRGIAYVVVGAPVGTRGDWIVRAALAADEASAWTFVGEYRARPDRPHRLRTGVTYSAQTLPATHGDVLHIAVPEDVLRVGGFYGYDRWNVGRGLELSYGGRVDRFDYLAGPNLAGGLVRVTQGIGSRTSVFAGASRHMVAPGADQFQPPSVTGVWLPPDRTFSTLDSADPIGAAEVDRHEFGANVRVSRRGRTDGEEEEEAAIGARHFLEHTSGQIATIFGLDESSPVGHYHVGAVGSPRVQGMTIEFAGPIGRRARGRLAYSLTETTWLPSVDFNTSAATLRLGLAGHDRRGHDVSTTVEGTLPVSETKVNLAVRINDWFGMPNGQPGVGTRFAVEVQQPLPIKGIGREAVVLVVSARTLLGDGGIGRSYLDDLVTIDPPLRVTCGIQMRF